MYNPWLEKNNFYKPKRAVITGIGMLSPLGNNLTDFSKKLFSGETGVKQTNIYTLIGKVKKIVWLVEPFDLNELLNEHELKRMDLTSQWLLYVARKAIQDAQIDFSKYGLEKCAIYLGSVISNLPPEERLELTDLVSGLRNIYPTRILEFRNQTIIRNLMNGLDVSGPGAVVCSNCSAGLNAISMAFWAVRDGRVPIAIAGGFEIFRAFVFTLLSEMGFLTPGECRPFDNEHNGMYMGESTVVFVIEEYEHAAARNAPMYAEIIGAGQGHDAYHHFLFSPLGTGVINAVTNALKSAGLKSADVDCIFADAKGIESGDCSEAYGLRAVFGANEIFPATCSVKAQTGHTLGGSGPLSMVASILSLSSGVLPQTIGYRESVHNLELPLTTTNLKNDKLSTALINAIGAGGNAGTILLRKIN